MSSVVSVSTQTDMTAPDLSLIFSLKGAAAAEASAGRKRWWSHRSRRGATGSQPASPEEQQARSSGGAAAAAAVEELHPDVWPPLSPQNLGRWDEGDEGRDEGRRWGKLPRIGVFDIGARGSEFSIARRHGGIPLEILPERSRRSGATFFPHRCSSQHRSSTLKDHNLERVP